MRKPPNLNNLDTWQKALTLAPYSLRLRAFLQVLGRHPDKPMGTSHPSRKLPQLVQEVETMSSSPSPLRPKQPTHAEAVAAMVNLPFLKTHKYRDQQSRANRREAHPDILRFERAFVRRCERLGIPMFAHSIVRDHAEQEGLFVRGVSKARGGKSPHNVGCAVDLVHGVFAWNLTKQQWLILHHIGKEVAASLGIAVEWGGSWQFYDPAHWQLKDWQSKALLGPFSRVR